MQFETPAKQSAPVTEAPPVRRALPKAWRARIDAFDDAVDGALDHVRGNPVADRVFYLATELGDWALIWHLIGTARGLLSDEKADEAIRLTGILGAETLLVNGVIKSFFRRTRPTWDQPRAYKIRRPRERFPSGHASSAFTAAGVLSQDDPLWPLYYGVAAIVATSRVYVRIHHASDVVGGIATGIVLGRLARRLWPKPTATGSSSGV